MSETPTAGRQQTPVPAKRIVAYADHLTAAPGDTVKCMVSTTAPQFRAELIRIISGDARSYGTGYSEVTVQASFASIYLGREQAIVPGSWAQMRGLPGILQASFTCWFMPTIGTGKQTLLTVPGGPTIEQWDAVIGLSDSAGWHPLPLPLQCWRWYALSLGCEGNATVLEIALCPAPNEASVTGRVKVAGPLDTEAGNWLLCSDGNRSRWNGRIEAPLIGSGARVPAAGVKSCTSAYRQAVASAIARWDFNSNLTSDHVPDATGNGHTAALFQQPCRAVTGVHWDGSVHRFTENPAHYGAAHFHEDDLTDCGWDHAFEWRISADVDSALYGFKLTALDGPTPADAPENEFILPLCITAPVSRRGDVALLVSTATYLSYANQQMSLRPSAILKNPRARNTSDAWLLEHPEIGLSQYDYHRDGSGVHFSSHLRPVLNLAPKVLPWGFCADTNITAWLEAIAQPFDIVTDEDLHRDGHAALNGYRVLLTCTHPEYHSTPMLDALTAFLDQGGRLMYLGGNGFYWRVAFHPEKPGLMEVRRAEDGTRAWMSRPGEYYHQFTGEFGGLWRRLGRPPNQLVGVGFAAQGFDGGTYYELMPGAQNPRVRFAMDGLAEGTMIGAYGTQAGGAAGEEIDRYDPLLGSPSHGLVIASSREHRPGMLRTIEEIHMTGPNDVPDDDIRSDLTFFETPAGGAVFAAGSISYAGALSPNGYQNDIARLTGNILRRFIDADPFTMP